MGSGSAGYDTAEFDRTILSWPYEAVGTEICLLDSSHEQNGKSMIFMG